MCILSLSSNIVPSTRVESALTVTFSSVLCTCPFTSLALAAQLPKAYAWIGRALNIRVAYNHLINQL